MIYVKHRLDLKPHKRHKHFDLTGIMANITFYVNVILNIFRIPVFIIVVEMYHGTIIALSFFDSFNLD